MTHQLDKAIQEKIQYKILADEKRDKVEILNDENKSLRVKIQDLEDDIKRYRKQLKQLQMTIEQQHQIGQELYQVKADLAYMTQQMNLKDKDFEESQKTIQNLHRAMATLSSQHEEEVGQMSHLKKQKELENL